MNITLSLGPLVFSLIAGILDSPADAAAVELHRRVVSDHHRDHWYFWRGLVALLTGEAGRRTARLSRWQETWMQRERMP